jgi:predicted ATPase/DNA-binding SARP family transcriptional activator
MKLRLLGSFGASENGEELDLGGRKPRALLAFIAANYPAPVPVDRCIQAVWGDEADSGSKRSLQTYVSSLRSAIDPNRLGRLEGSNDAYRLVLFDGDTIDLEEFRRLASPAASSEASRAVVERLTSALQMWTDSPLGDLSYDDWAQPLMRQWSDERLTAAMAWADAHIQAGTPGESVGMLERLSGLHPLHEGLVSRLMTALYQTGRQSEALEAFRELTHRLGEELGLDPSPELLDLEERILLHDQSLQIAKPTPTNLDMDGEIIGREQEIATLMRLIDSTRLLTITGAGGSGKTTAARRVAQDCMSVFTDGVWWIGLAGLSDAHLIPHEMLGAMRLPAPVGVPALDSLIAHLTHQKTFLVLDNCEHLADGVADVISKILRSTTETSVLATSREQLSIAGEVSWRLPTLTAPGDASAEGVLASAAGQLFAVRARTADPNFAVTDENAPRVASICRRLDGLPLAIELAAARLSSMGLGELEGRLEDRFLLLTGGDSGDAPHQRTLRGTVEWSYDLLGDEEQRLYRQLSVFRGGFDLGVVEAVFESPDPVRPLDSLLTQSLIVADASSMPTRYSMLETIREHGRELLTVSGELEEALTKHLSTMASLVSEGARHLEGPDQQAWMTRFRRETDNLRAAMAFAVDADPVTGAAIASGLGRFWWAHAMERDPTTLEDATSFLEEGRAWSTAMLEEAGESLPVKLHARLLTSLGGLLEIRLGLLSDAIGHLDEAIELWSEIGDPRNQGWAVFYRGCAGWDMTSIDETVAAFEQACSLHEKAGDPFGLGFSQLMRGFAYAVREEFDLAAKDFTEFSEVAEKVRNPNMIAHADDAYACLAVLTGSRSDEDRARVAASIRRFRRISNYACLAHGIHNAAAWLAAEDKLEESARCLGIVQTLRDRLTMVLPPYEDRTFVVDGAGLSQLDQRLRHREFELGRAMEPEDGIEWVLAKFAT